MRRTCVHFYPNFRIQSLLVFYLATFSISAAAWNTTGHREVVAVAWSFTDFSTRQAIHQLLDSSDTPAVTRGLKGESAWMAASLWPDELRDRADSDVGLRRPSSLNQWLERGRTGEATRRWHFADRNIVKPFHQQTAHGLLEAALEAHIMLLANPALPKASRAIALAWVSHLVADAHQPLHAASRPDPQRPGQLDAGGNTVTVIDSGRKPPDPLSLHRWWDELPGHAKPDSPRFISAVDRSARLASQLPMVVIVKSPSAWVEESFDIAREHVYPGLVRDPENPTVFLIRQDYWLDSRDITRQRLALAGRRLAHIVTQALQDLR
jgi:S1/P1 Nuclease